jgi:hypothetical protein
MIAPDGVGCKRLTGVGYGFTPTELNRITAIVREHEAELLKARHDYFNSSD